jgi:hypothetical protein
MSKFPLNAITLSPTKLQLGRSLLLDMESECTPTNSNSEVNELKAQLEIVIEDRERLKHQCKSLESELSLDLYGFLLRNIGSTTKAKDSSLELMQANINKIRQECEAKDKVLSTMRKLLGSEDYSKLMKENVVEKQSQTPLKSRIRRTNTRIQYSGRSCHNRSNSPFSRLVN